MKLINIILLLFPGCFSVYIDNLINDVDLLKNKYLMFIKYIAYTFFILLCSFLVIYLLVGSEANWFYSVDSISFVVKYLLLSFVVSIILPIIYKYLKNNFEIKLEFKKGKQK